MLNINNYLKAKNVYITEFNSISDFNDWKSNFPLYNILDDGVYSSLFAEVPETYQTLQNCLTQMMHIGINMSKEMRAAVKTFRGDSVLEELKKFEKTLSQTLLSNTEVMLIDKFENNDMSF